MELKDFVNKLLEEDWYVDQWVSHCEFRMRKDGHPLTIIIALWNNNEEILVYKGVVDTSNLITKVAIKKLTLAEDGRIVYPRTIECGIFEDIKDLR